MKRKLSLIAALALSAVCLTGCGIVTVVPIGEEASFTGQQEFDSSAESSGDWAAVAEEITGAATDLVEVLEFNTETPKYYLLITPEGYSGSEEFRIQAGGVYSGTAIRDAQTVKNFESFTNQTEWSQYAKALNEQADTQVVAPLALDESAAGKTVTFVGAAVQSGDTVTITPVSMTIE